MIQINKLYETISYELALVEDKIAGIVSNINEYDDNFGYVKDISDYFFRLPGKKLRPALAIFSAYTAKKGKLSKTELDNIIVFATAIELIHSASLIHDDIIDCDVVRRGQPSVNGKFGTQTSVLFGDMIYAEAFVQLTDLKVANGDIKNRVIRGVSEMSRDMCVGEIEEIRYDNNYTATQYKSVIEKKTASLMTVSCKWAAMITGCDERIVQVLSDYGYNIGLLYQVIDDGLDGNVSVSGLDFQDYINTLAEMATKDFSILEQSPYKQKMCDFIEYIKERI